jgi:hypothetical protein
MAKEILREAQYYEGLRFAELDVTLYCLEILKKQSLNGRNVRFRSSRQLISYFLKGLQKRICYNLRATSVNEELSLAFL